MKTKINEVPLVGPRGRKELLAKINELEKKVAELESNQPETHKLTITGLLPSGTIQECLSVLKLDGSPISDVSELYVLTPKDIVEFINDGVTTSYTISSLLIQPDNMVSISGGLSYTDQEILDLFVIFFGIGDDSGIVNVYIM